MKKPSVYNEYGYYLGVGIRREFSKHLELNIEANFTAYHADIYYESSYFAPLGNRNYDREHRYPFYTVNIQLPIMLGVKLFGEKLVIHGGGFVQSALYNKNREHVITITYVDEHFLPLPEAQHSDSLVGGTMRTSLLGILGGIKIKIINKWAFNGRYYFPLTLTNRNIGFRQTFAQLGIVYHLSK